MKAKIISAFPGCGKTTYCKDWGKNENNKFGNHNIGDIILDSDSSEFSWVKDSEGNNTKERNPEFPNNYIQHIKDNIYSANIIFVSSHKVVRDALKEHGIDYHIFYPDKSLKETWLEIYRNRGNDESFINFISDNWETFIDEIENDNFPTKHKLDGSNNNKFISVHNISEILKKENYETEYPKSK